jgi:predicted enzyme related to lactoylglutathione lyase
MTTHFILYVRDQHQSAAFYETALGLTPELDVEGMTEFRISTATILGLMPSHGIERLLGGAPGNASAVPSAMRAELYLVVDNVQAYHRRAVEGGARELSPLLPRGWGHAVAYSVDADGYVLAFDNVSGVLQSTLTLLLCYDSGHRCVIKHHPVRKSMQRMLQMYRRAMDRCHRGFS